jgi:hypothetical protein
MVAEALEATSPFNNPRHRNIIKYAFESLRRQTIVSIFYDFDFKMTEILL